MLMRIFTRSVKIKRKDRTMRYFLVITLSLALIVGCGKGEKEKTAAEAPANKPKMEQPSQPGTDILVKTDAPTPIPEDQYVTTPSGLKYADIKVGTGAQPKPGDYVVVHYTGWLTNGKRFDSSVLREKPFKFQLGKGKVIAGWDEGVASMKVGGVRQLVIPPQLAYGNRGVGGVIPPNATLIFEVQLLRIE